MAQRNVPLLSSGTTVSNPDSLLGLASGHNVFFRFADVVTSVLTGSHSKLATTAGAGITNGSGTVYANSVQRVGSLYITRILVDLTGLNSGGTAGDVIGVNGAGAAHLGQITTARCGTIYGGSMTCLELPAGGDTDIDLYAATEATGVEDTAISALDETQLINAGASALGTVDFMSSLPAADQYLYLVGQGTTNDTYTAGRLLIELWGA